VYHTSGQQCSGCQRKSNPLSWVVGILFGLLLAGCTVEMDVTVLQDEQWEAVGSMEIPPEMAEAMGGIEGVKEQMEEDDDEGIFNSGEARVEETSDGGIRIIGETSGQGFEKLNEDTFDGNATITTNDQGHVTISNTYEQDTSDINMGITTIIKVTGNEIIQSNANRVEGGTAIWENPNGTIEVTLIPLQADSGGGGSTGGQQQQTGERCFPETGRCIEGSIRTYWEQNGGLSVFGYPISPQGEETVEDRTIQVQWFERDRLEIQNDGTVTAGRLGARFLELRGTPWRDYPSPPSQDVEMCHYFPETGHSICPPFTSFWEPNGGLERIGYPITEAFEETIEGKTLVVQYFERRRMEMHPDNPPPYQMQFGLLGKAVYQQSGP